MPLEVKNSKALRWLGFALMVVPMPLYFFTVFVVWSYMRPFLGIINSTALIAMAIAVGLSFIGIGLHTYAGEPDHGK